jgi:hypothetical protein
MRGRKERKESARERSVNRERELLAVVVGGGQQKMRTSAEGGEIVLVLVQRIRSKNKRRVHCSDSL